MKAERCEVCGTPATTGRQGHEETACEAVVARARAALRRAAADAAALDERAAADHNERHALAG